MDSKTIRYKNARMLVREAGGVSAFAEKLGKQQSQVSAIAGENPTKGIGAKIARQIEVTFIKPNGWLDVPHKEEWEARTRERESSRIGLIGSVAKRDSRYGEPGQWGAPDDADEAVPRVMDEQSPYGAGDYDAPEELGTFVPPATQHGKRVVRMLLQADADGALSPDLAQHLIATIELYRKRDS